MSTTAHYEAERGTSRAPGVASRCALGPHFQLFTLFKCLLVRAMKTKRLLAILLPVPLVISACSHDNKEADKKESAPAAKSEKAAEPESRVSHGTNGEVIVKLDASTQKLISLQATELKSTRLNPELKAYGHVLDISPLASLVADLSTAQAASVASQAELQRLKTLAAQDNASQRALQAAEATAVHDRAQVDSATLRLESTWGTALAKRKDLADLVHAISALEAALTEVDVPAGQTLSGNPTGARLFSLADETNPIAAELVGPFPQVDPQLQGRGFLFLVSPNPAHLATGAAVTALLTLPGEAQPGVLLPRSAVVRYIGATWVYVQVGDDTFERREISLVSPLADGWFVREGLKPGDKVVTAAAQQILSEELKGQSGE